MKRNGMIPGCVACVVLSALAAHADAGLTFNLVKGSGLTDLETSDPTRATNMENGFAAAAARWSSLFTDNMTVNLTIDSAALSAGVIGSTSTTNTTYFYSNVQPALIADVTSVNDVSAAAHLQTGPLRLMLNRTSDNPNGSGSATPYLDADGGGNNSVLRLSNANAKAIGLLAGNNAANDATIQFSSTFAFDFDPSNGIDGAQLDFVGVATHEIGHALGFSSGVDILDVNSPPNGGPFSGNAFSYVTALDLYRYSANSVANGALDFTADSSTKYFSIDGGATALAPFSTGAKHGDGSQASHWKDNLGIGIMDPTFANGELGVITARDVQAFDVIGYDVVPEPGTISLLAIGTASLLRRRRSRSH